MIMVSESLVTPEDRIVHFIEFLKESGRVRFKNEVFEKIGISRQHYILIKTSDSTKRFTTDHIKSLCKHYRINANWIFGVEEEMFRK